MSWRELRFLLLIIAIYVAASLETDIYLPAFPDMMHFFGVSEAKIQGLLTWNFVGICLSGPLYGPLSDSYGRRWPLLLSLALFFIGSGVTLLAQTFSVMLAGRVLQGLGSGGCFTLGTAIIFDAFQAERAVMAVNTLNSIFPFILAGAPTLGSYLNQAYGFRANFWAVMVLVAFSATSATLFFKETLPAAQRLPLRLARVATDFFVIGKSIPFLLLVLPICLLFSVWMAFLSTVSVLFVLELGVPANRFALFQSFPLVAWLLASLTAQRALRRWGMSRLQHVSLGLMALGALCLVFGAIGWPRNPYVSTASMGLYAFGLDWFGALYFPEAMGLFPDKRGSAASLLTSIRLLIAASMVSAVGALYDRSIGPVSVATLVAVCLSIPMLLLYEKRYGKQFKLAPA